MRTSKFLEQNITELSTVWFNCDWIVIEKQRLCPLSSGDKIKQ